MRGVFGVPGLGLQRPQAPDTKTSEDDPGNIVYIMFMTISLLVKENI